MTGVDTLKTADWLLGFDFDGTLADVTAGHTVSSEFFSVLSRIKSERELAWGICTGRSLEHLIEGMEQAEFPYHPDFIVSQERDIYYRIASTPVYEPDKNRNVEAHESLHKLLRENSRTITKIQRFIKEKTKAEWVSIPGDPAGMIASHINEVDAVVKVYENCREKSDLLEYQRSTIYLRFSHQSYCKGSAIQYLQTKFNLSHDKTLVMGDNYNDITMLNPKIAKYFGSPANAVSLLKETLHARGGFITDTSYSTGVIEALNRLFPSWL